jgi:hypothetical protein
MQKFVLGYPDLRYLSGHFRCLCRNRNVPSALISWTPLKNSISVATRIINKRSVELSGSGTTQGAYQVGSSGFLVGDTGLPAGRQAIGAEDARSRPCGRDLARR